ncbi:MAG TPA: TIGR03118 family protein [Aromatoleum sp.]|uniref:TIGR03118 family protein n=1 Tax=Aromatoleum sp. TaxID=2307007 RepID=UPI002B482263|nr:TIGR03118 family protein [Aromatoleum sp.]HJV26015.1 TIGR03118 family protein [Aromatoleum sp.]
MKSTLSPARRCALSAAFMLGVTLAAPVLADDNRYEQQNLVSDGVISAAHVDANLVNAWGVAFNPNAFVWVADNGTGVATLYDGQGNAQPLVVTIPSATGAQGEHGKPTGIIFNGSNDFAVGNGATTGPSRFIFATEDGVIAGWAPNVDPTHALQAVVSAGAIYKGLALAANGNGNFLYATDFHNSKIDVFDKAFGPVATPGGFADPAIPKGFAPFGIQNINGNLYVTYAKQDAAGEDDVAGPGLGFVNVFDADGHLLRHVAHRGALNAPWGLALAPADFGKFSNRLLVGNFGDGTIVAYDIHTGALMGRLQRADGGLLKIDGLWALQFGNGILQQPTNALFFSAGPDDENHGLYGAIRAVGNDEHDDRHDEAGTR